MSKRFLYGKRRILGIPNDGWGILQIGTDKGQPNYYSREPQYMGTITLAGHTIALSGWLKTRLKNDVILIHVEHPLSVGETKERKKTPRILQWKAVKWDDEFEFGEKL